MFEYTFKFTNKDVVTVEMPVDKLGGFIFLISELMGAKETQKATMGTSTTKAVSKTGKRLGRPPKAKVQAVAA